MSIDIKLKKENQKLKIFEMSSLNFMILIESNDFW